MPGLNIPRPTEAEFADYLRDQLRAGRDKGWNVRYIQPRYAANGSVVEGSGHYVITHVGAQGELLRSNLNINLGRESYFTANYGQGDQPELAPEIQTKGGESAFVLGGTWFSQFSKKGKKGPELISHELRSPTQSLAALLQTAFSKVSKQNERSPEKQSEVTGTVMQMLSAGQKATESTGAIYNAADIPAGAILVQQGVDQESNRRAAAKSIQLLNKYTQKSLISIFDQAQAIRRERESMITSNLKVPGVAGADIAPFFRSAGYARDRASEMRLVPYGHGRQAQVDEFGNILDESVWLPGSIKHRTLLDVGRPQVSLLGQDLKPLQARDIGRTVKSGYRYTTADVGGRIPEKSLVMGTLFSPQYQIPGAGMLFHQNLEEKVRSGGYKTTPDFGVTKNVLDFINNKVQVEAMIKEGAVIPSRLSYNVASIRTAQMAEEDPSVIMRERAGTHSLSIGRQRIRVPQYFNVSGMGETYDPVQAKANKQQMITQAQISALEKRYGENYDIVVDPTTDEVRIETPAQSLTDMKHAIGGVKSAFVGYEGTPTINAGGTKIPIGQLTWESKQMLETFTTSLGAISPTAQYGILTDYATSLRASGESEQAKAILGEVKRVRAERAKNARYRMDLGELTTAVRGTGTPVHQLTRDIFERVMLGGKTTGEFEKMSEGQLTKFAQSKRNLGNLKRFGMGWVSPEMTEPVTIREDINQVNDMLRAYVRGSKGKTSDEAKYLFEKRFGYDFANVEGGQVAKTFNPSGFFMPTIAGPSVEFSGGGTLGSEEVRAINALFPKFAKNLGMSLQAMSGKGMLTSEIRDPARRALAQVSHIAINEMDRGTSNAVAMPDALMVTTEMARDMRADPKMKAILDEAISGDISGLERFRERLFKYFPEKNMEDRPIGFESAPGRYLASVGATYALKSIDRATANEVEGSGIDVTQNWQMLQRAFKGALGAQSVEDEAGILKATRNITGRYMNMAGLPKGIKRKSIQKMLGSEIAAASGHYSYWGQLQQHEVYGTKEKYMEAIRTELVAQGLDTPENPLTQQEVEQVYNQIAGLKSTTGATPKDVYKRGLAGLVGRWPFVSGTESVLGMRFVTDEMLARTGRQAPPETGFAGKVWSIGVGPSTIMQGDFDWDYLFGLLGLKGKRNRKGRLSTTFGGYTEKGNPFRELTRGINRTMNTPYEEIQELFYGTKSAQERFDPLMGAFSDRDPDRNKANMQQVARMINEQFDKAGWMSSKDLLGAVRQYSGAKEQMAWSYTWSRAMEAAGASSGWSTEGLMYGLRSRAQFYQPHLDLKTDVLAPMANMWKTSFLREGAGEKVGLGWGSMLDDSENITWTPDVASAQELSVKNVENLMSQIAGEAVQPSQGKELPTPAALAYAFSPEEERMVTAPGTEADVQKLYERWQAAEHGKGKAFAQRGEREKEYFQSVGLENALAVPFMNQDLSLEDRAVAMRKTLTKWMKHNYYGTTEGKTKVFGGNLINAMFSEAFARHKKKFPDWQLPTEFMSGPLGPNMLTRAVRQQPMLKMLKGSLASGSELRKMMNTMQAKSGTSMWALGNLMKRIGLGGDVNLGVPQGLTNTQVVQPKFGTQEEEISWLTQQVNQVRARRGAGHMTASRLPWEGTAYTGDKKLGEIGREAHNAIDAFLETQGLVKGEQFEVPTEYAGIPGISDILIKDKEQLKNLGLPENLAGRIIDIKTSSAGPKRFASQLATYVFGGEGQGVQQDIASVMSIPRKAIKKIRKAMGEDPITAEHNRRMAAGIKKPMTEQEEENLAAEQQAWNIKFGGKLFEYAKSHITNLGPDQISRKSIIDRLRGTAKRERIEFISEDEAAKQQAAAASATPGAQGPTQPTGGGGGGGGGTSRPAASTSTPSPGGGGATRGGTPTGGGPTAAAGGGGQQPPDDDRPVAPTPPEDTPAGDRSTRVASGPYNTSATNAALDFMKKYRKLSPKINFMSGEIQTRMEELTGAAPGAMGVSAALDALGISGPMREQMFPMFQKTRVKANKLVTLGEKVARWNKQNRIDPSAAGLEGLQEAINNVTITENPLAQNIVDLASVGEGTTYNEATRKAMVSEVAKHHFDELSKITQKLTENFKQLGTEQGRHSKALQDDTKELVERKAIVEAQRKVSEKAAPLVKEGYLEVGGISKEEGVTYKRTGKGLADAKAMKEMQDYQEQVLQSAMMGPPGEGGGGGGAGGLMPGGIRPSFMRRVLGGFGLMYLRSLGNIITGGLGYGQQERIGLQEQLGTAAGRMTGAGYTPTNQMQELKNRMALGGQAYNPLLGLQMARARSPFLQDVSTAAGAGFGTYALLQQAAMWGGDKSMFAQIANGGWRPWEGSTGLAGKVNVRMGGVIGGALGLSLLAQAYGKSRDVEGLAYRMGTSTPLGAAFNLTDTAGALMSGQLRDISTKAASYKALQGALQGTINYGRASAYTAASPWTPGAPSWQVSPVEQMMQNVQGAVTPGLSTAGMSFEEMIRVASQQRGQNAAFGEYGLVGAETPEGKAWYDRAMRELLVDQYSQFAPEVTGAAYGFMKKTGIAKPFFGDIAAQFQTGFTEEAVSAGLRGFGVSLEEQYRIPQMNVPMTGTIPSRLGAAYLQTMGMITEQNMPMYEAGLAHMQKLGNAPQIMAKQEGLTDKQVIEQILQWGGLEGMQEQLHTAQMLAYEQMQQVGMEVQAPTEPGEMTAPMFRREMRLSDIQYKAAQYDPYALTQAYTMTMPSGALSGRMPQPEAWQVTRDVWGEGMGPLAGHAVDLPAFTVSGASHPQFQNLSNWLGADFMKELAGTGAGQAFLEGYQMEGTNMPKIAGTMGYQMYQADQQYALQQAQIGLQSRGNALQMEYLPKIWGIQDQMRALGYEQQQWQFGQQEQQLQMNLENFLQNQGMNIYQAQLQRGWTREDWGYQDTMRGMQHGWRVEDFEEQRRFMTGRQRRLAERQMERENITYGMEGEQIDKKRQQQEELWALEDERFDIQREQYMEQYKMQEEAIKKQREYYEENYRLQTQLTELQRELTMKQLALQREGIELQRKMAEENHKMQQTQQAINLLMMAAQSGMEITATEGQTFSDAMQDWLDGWIEWINGGGGNAAVPNTGSGGDQEGTGSDNGSGGGGAITPRCFLPGTMIEMADGTKKRIDKIQENDQVLSYDERIDKYVPNIVGHVMVHPPIKFDEHYLINDTLRGTHEHRMYVLGEERDYWERIRNLKVGMIIKGLDGKNITIEKIEVVKENSETYNLHCVNQPHNYFADGFLAHNAKIEDIAMGSSWSTQNVSTIASVPTQGDTTIVVNIGNEEFDRRIINTIEGVA